MVARTSLSENNTLISQITSAEKYLKAKGIDTPRLDAEVLIGCVLKKDRSKLYADLLESISVNDIMLIEEIIKKRGEFVPVAYLIGKKEFMSLEFTVTPEVLIPRPETENMVEMLIEELKKYSKPYLIDVGTGSGAIAISIAKFVPEAQVIAIDISPEALKVAGENAKAHSIGDRITFLQGNLVEPLTKDLQGKINCIAANLPYIPEREMLKLQPEVRLNEPELALTAGEDGFIYYDQLIPRAQKLLRPKGILALEIGYNQGQIAKEKLTQKQWQKVQIIKDFQNLDRLVWARKLW